MNGTKILLRAITFGDILASVSAITQVPESDLIGPRRTRSVYLARKIVYQLARELTNLSLAQIGDMSRKDPSSVRSGAPRSPRIDSLLLGGVQVGLVVEMARNRCNAITGHDEYSQTGVHSPRTVVYGPQIISAVCNETQVPYSEIIRNGRNPDTVLARRLIVIVCRCMTSMSYPEITRLVRPNSSSHSSAIGMHKAGLKCGLQIAADRIIREFRAEPIQSRRL